MNCRKRLSAAGQERDQPRTSLLAACSFYLFSMSGFYTHLNVNFFFLSSSTYTSLKITTPEAGEEDGEQEAEKQGKVRILECLSGT